MPRTTQDHLRGYVVPRSLETLTQLTPISEKEKDIPDDDFDFPT